MHSAEYLHARHTHATRRSVHMHEKERNSNTHTKKDPPQSRAWQGCWERLVGFCFGGGDRMGGGSRRGGGQGRKNDSRTWEMVLLKWHLRTCSTEEVLTLMDWWRLFQKARAGVLNRGTTGSFVCIMNDESLRWWGVTAVVIGQQQQECWVWIEV